MVAAAGGIRRRWHDRPCCSPDRTILARADPPPAAGDGRAPDRPQRHADRRREGARKRGRQRAPRRARGRATIRTAEDVARARSDEGALMKAGQLISFIVEALPEEAQQALATLQAGAPPMAPSLAAEVVREELGGDPERIFLDWSPEPAAAASISQVHRAVTRDGRTVAVKVQVPRGRRSDHGRPRERRDPLRHVRGVRAEGSRHTGTGRRAAIAHGGGARLPPRGAESAGASTTPVTRSCGFPPWSRNSRRRACSPPSGSTATIGRRSWRRPATTPGSGRGRSSGASPRLRSCGWVRSTATPIGNYRFHDDGTVTFLDFGLVKRWSPGEWERLAPSLDAIYERDPDRLVSAMEAGGVPATWPVSTPAPCTTT